MAKTNQPYIPLYTGDYIKDTRSLSLAAKGAWSDLIIFMWSAERRGILEGTQDDFARIIGSSREEFAEVLLELRRKNIADITDLPGGVIRIANRRQVREAAISAIRSEVGKIGAGKTNGKKSAKASAKIQQIHDNDIDNEDVNGIEEKGVQGEIDEEIKEAVEESIRLAFGETFVEELKLSKTYVDVDIGKGIEMFKTKVRGSYEDYFNHDVPGMRKALHYQLRHTKPEKKFNGQGQGKTGGSGAKFSGTGYNEPL